jgi:hypothetical protein
LIKFRNVWTRRNPPTSEDGNQFQNQNPSDTDNLTQRMNSFNLQDNQQQQQQRPYRNARPQRDSNGNAEQYKSDDQRQFDKKDKKKRDKRYPNQQQQQTQIQQQSAPSQSEVIQFRKFLN